MYYNNIMSMQKTTYDRTFKQHFHVHLKMRKGYPSFIRRLSLSHFDQFNNFIYNTLI